MKDEQLQGVTPELRDQLMPILEKCRAAEDSFTVPENLFFGIMLNHLDHRTPIPHNWIEVLYKLTARLDCRFLAEEWDNVTRGELDIRPADRRICKHPNNPVWECVPGCVPGCPFTEDGEFEYEVVAYEYICGLRVFTVHGVDANEEDFVEQDDRDPGNAPDRGCGYMQATVIPATEKVLKKYNITLEEYTTIAEDVAEKLSFGRCGKCS